MRRIAGMLVAVLIALVAISAQATPITFTFTTTGMSGTLGGSTFSNQTLTVTTTADTANLLNCGNFIAYESPCDGPGALTGAFTLGAWSGTFTDPLYVFKASADIGFGLTVEGTSSDRLDPWFLPAFFYDMVSTYGPITSTGGSVPYMQFSGDGTSLGSLTTSGGVATSFAAVLGSPVNAPEPGALGLFALGLLGLLGLALKRRA